MPSKVKTIEKVAKKQLLQKKTAPQNAILLLRNIYYFTQHI